VRPDELLPSRAPTTVGRWCDVVSAQDIANGLVRQVMAQVGQCAYDAGVARLVFSRANRTTRASTAGSTRGRPRYARYREPSNLRAMSRWYHPRMVSGFAGRATSFSAFRPSRFADLRQCGPLGIRQPQTSREVRPQNAVFRRQVFILEQQLLID
jgi:hypothetical protein